MMHKPKVLPSLGMRKRSSLFKNVISTEACNTGWSSRVTKIDSDPVRNTVMEKISLIDDTLSSVSLPNQEIPANDDSPTQNLDQAFVEEQWNTISPIQNEFKVQNEETHKSTSSTPFSNDEVTSTIKRSVKRRRRSRLSAKKIRKAKLDDKTYGDCGKWVGAEECLKNNPDCDDSLIASLELEECTPVFRPTQDVENNDKKPMISASDIVETSDSLLIPADINSKLITSTDELLLANDTTMDIDIDKGAAISEYPEDKIINSATFFGLPLKVKEILKSQRGIENVYGE